MYGFFKKIIKSPTTPEAEASEGSRGREEIANILFQPKTEGVGTGSEGEEMPGAPSSVVAGFTHIIPAAQGKWGASGFR